MRTSCAVGGAARHTHDGEEEADAHTHRGSRPPLSASAQHEMGASSNMAVSTARLAWLRALMPNHVGGDRRGHGAREVIPSAHQSKKRTRIPHFSPGRISEGGSRHS
eukprot:scaffold51240_cov63-Phaeocystis_antarctica.AAC.2